MLVFSCRSHRQSFSTRVTGAAMHVARAGTAPLFAGGTRFGAADVATGSSIQTRRRGFGGGGEDTARGAGLSKNVNLMSRSVWGEGTGTGRLRGGDVDAAGAGGVDSAGAGGVHAAVKDGCGRRGTRRVGLQNAQEFVLVTRIFFK